MAGYAAAVPLSAGFPAARPDSVPRSRHRFPGLPARLSEPFRQRMEFQYPAPDHQPDTLSVAYVGQNGAHILINPNINQASPGPGAVASRRPYPNLADGTLNCTCANSSYNSLQATYKSRRFPDSISRAHTLMLTASITPVATRMAVGIQNPRISAFTAAIPISTCATSGPQLVLRSALRERQEVSQRAAGWCKRQSGDGV